MANDIHIPIALIESMRGQRVIPFLGAGASMESADAAGRHPPSAPELRTLLGNKFFGNAMDEYDLTVLSEMAIQAHGQAVVFECVRTILEPFKPSQAHSLLPMFRWRAIVTTNYDLLIDLAYSLSQDRLQTAIAFVKDREPVEERLKLANSPLPYLKLHGCLNHLHDAEIPLVLSNAHYSRYAIHRIHLYNRLKAWTHESTFVFCGYKLGDAHIRKIIYDLG